MKVPYAKKWEKETDALRKIAVGCGLEEELKWGKPCFTHQKKNVAIIIPLKETCAFSFFKGALLKDPKRGFAQNERRDFHFARGKKNWGPRKGRPARTGVLQKIGQQQAGRWIKFRSLKEIAARSAILKRHIQEAVRIEESGRKVRLKKISDYVIPEQLQAQLDAAPKLKAAFEALTPGRRKSHILHIARAKRTETRAARAEKCVPMILSGRGFNERVRAKSKALR